MCGTWKLSVGGLTGLQLIMVEFVMTGTCAWMPSGFPAGRVGFKDGDLPKKHPKLGNPWNMEQKAATETQVCPQEMAWFIDGYRMSQEEFWGM